VLQLAVDRTPMTVASFVGLAEGTIANDAFPPGVPFFDGSTFHRVVPGHVIQGGAPASEEAGEAGYTIPNEIDTTLSHGRSGMLGMANAGPHSADNQFYITLGDRSYLDGDYALFGEVVDGMGVVTAIEQDDPIDSIRIVRSGAAAEAFRPTTAEFQALVDRVRNHVEQESEAKRVAEADYIQRNWPDALTAASGAQYVVEREGSGEPPQAGDTLRLRYRGYTLSGKNFASLGDTGLPYWGEVNDPGQAFTYVVDQTEVTPALDAAVGQLLEGERRIIIVPAAQGYGQAGYYAPERPGEPRFVISPGTTLVYFVERLRR
jgi:peptidylprolyl isomerase